MTKQNYTIWSNYDLNYDDWKSDLEEQYPDMTEEERINAMYYLNDLYIDDERINLNIQLNREIIVIADLGLWNGRHSGYKEIKSGNISDCLSSDADYFTWYIDKLGDLRCDAAHHDGTNHYIYRVYKDDATDTQIENLKDKIYYGTVTRADITRITRRLGDDIGKVYGWKL